MNSFSCDPRVSFAERRLGARPAATMVTARPVKGDVMI